MNKITLYKWAAKHNAADLVHEALQPAIRFSKAQCLDLPPVLTTTREVPLTIPRALSHKFQSPVPLVFLISTNLAPLVKPQLIVLGKQDNVGEAVEDTFQDLSVYGVICQLVNRGKWAK